MIFCIAFNQLLLFLCAKARKERALRSHGETYDLADCVFRLFRVVPTDRYFPCIGKKYRRKQFEQRRFSAAIRPQQDGDLSGFELDRDVV